MTVRTFRDLVAWQKGMELVRAIYRLTQHWPPEETYGLTSQIRRAAVSVPSNIAEGHGRRADRELARFLGIAHGSLMEVETQLEIAFDLGYIPQSERDKLLALAGEVGRTVFGLIRKASNS